MGVCTVSSHGNLVTEKMKAEFSNDLVILACHFHPPWKLMLSKVEIIIIMLPLVHVDLIYTWYSSFIE